MNQIIYQFNYDNLLADFVFSHFQTELIAFFCQQLAFQNISINIVIIWDKIYFMTF